MHYPALYTTDDSLFMVFSRIDTSTATDDTLARIDMGFVGSSSTKEVMKATFPPASTSSPYKPSKEYGEKNG